jgi:threonine synthase
MSHIDLACIRCGRGHEPVMSVLRCERCQEPLVVRYQAGYRPEHQWAGSPFPAPFHGPPWQIGLGEGNTPVIATRSIGETLGLRRLWAKLEYMNPTGSFKDRGTAVMMSMAKELGVARVVEDSSGNAGASVAAYAARAGIEAHVFAPASTPPAKLAQIVVYGAQTHPIEGPREAATDAATAYYEEHGLVYASHNLSPFFLEGTKTFAYEVAHEMAEAMPDHVVIPVGNGGLFIGAWLGFQEMVATGRLQRAPGMHAIQARAVMPVAAAFAGEAWSPEPGTRTIAGGIAVGAPPRLEQTLDVLRSSGGRSLAVDDESIVAWQKTLALREGIYCEPTSAAAFAGLEVLASEGHVGPDDVVLVAVTGFGLKDDPPV